MAVTAICYLRNLTPCVTLRVLPCVCDPE